MNEKYPIELLYIININSSAMSNLVNLHPDILSVIISYLNDIDMKISNNKIDNLIKDNLIIEFQQKVVILMYCSGLEIKRICGMIGYILLQHMEANLKYCNGY